MPVAPPPIPTPFSGPTTPSLGWTQWFQSITNALGSFFGATAAPTAGPVNKANVAQWIQVQVGKESYWAPLYK